ncbi:protein BPS1, chloroplastic-like [Nicotiana tabacum]|uniref:Protein BPS1, chloroplastic-like n=2 Tax=Nicotiana TaxID=4085 RepID=A0A1S4BMW0_TOBAC|nr:PREDICTED: protein BPS1, chloroplastic-like [Nicotiana sylvestris]XP_016490206.1 PREDICTED: protein BPS1, chloroplastic-like [Nicotiana tabacum]
MVLLVEKISHFLKHPNRLENQHHNSEALLASSLQVFRSDVSKILNKVLPIPEPGTEPEFQFLSLAWIHNCLDAIPMMHRAFAKLVVQIDHPINRWEKSQVEEYLDYTLNLLELLNSVTSGVSHLSHARLCISHGLSLLEKNSYSPALEHLKEIQPHDLGKEFKVEGKTEESSCSGKDLITHQSLWILRSISFWVFGVMLSGICSDVKPYMELRISAGLFDDSLIKGWDSVLAKEIAQNCGVSKEVKEINEVVTSLKSAVPNGEVDEIAKQHRRRLEDLGELLQTMGKKTNDLFTDVLAERSKFLDSLQHTRK